MLIMFWYLDFGVCLVKKMKGGGECDGLKSVSDFRQISDKL